MRYILYSVISIFFINPGKAQQTTVQSHAKNSHVFSFVEKMPEFPGGDAALAKSLKENITYPSADYNNKTEGKVIIKFVVETDASADEVKVVKSVSPGLDNEAVRVVKLLPKFKPGMTEGKPVRVYFTLPIIFKLPH